MKKIDKLYLKRKKILSLPVGFHLIFIFLVLVNISIITFSAGVEEIKRNIQIINPRPDFDLSLSLNKGVGATYVTGEKVVVSFSVNKHSHVVIFGYDSGGRVQLLFPNESQKDSRLMTNHKNTLEFVIGRDEKTAIEYIQGFATIDPILLNGKLILNKEKDTLHVPFLSGDAIKLTKDIKKIFSVLPNTSWVSSEILHYKIVDRRPGTGHLYITSQPDSASVYINNRFSGTTPLHLENLPIGEYQIDIELSGYENWGKIILIDDNRTTFLTADLKDVDQFGSISILCNKDFARVYLDGQFKRLTQSNKEIVVEKVSAGFHDLGISLNGYYNWFQRVEVSPYQRTRLTVELEKIEQTGSLEISGNIDNSFIYLNGKLQLNNTPHGNLIIENLPEGFYDLRITKDGHYDYTATVAIYANITSKINVLLQTFLTDEQPGVIAVYCNINDAKIFINGEYRELTATDNAKFIIGLNEGAYQITVVKEGYRIWEEDVYVSSDKTISVFADLMKLKKQ